MLLILCSLTYSGYTLETAVLVVGLTAWVVCLIRRMWPLAQYLPAIPWRLSNVVDLAVFFICIFLLHIVYNLAYVTFSANTRVHQAYRPGLDNRRLIGPTSIGPIGVPNRPHSAWCRGWHWCDIARLVMTLLSRRLRRYTTRISS